MNIPLSTLTPEEQAAIHSALSESSEPTSGHGDGVPLSSLHPDAQHHIRIATGNHTTDDLHRVAIAAAQENGIDPGVFVRQIQQESGFNTKAKSKAGAVGIAQIMPDTAKHWGVDPHDPVASLNAAAKNMAAYQHTYMRQGHDPTTATALALAAYNAGPGAVAKHGGIPPYAETQHYVRAIMGGRDASGSVSVRPIAAGNSANVQSAPALLSDTDILHGVQPTNNISQQVHHAVQQVQQQTAAVPATVSAQAQPISAPTAAPTASVQTSIQGLKALTQPTAAATVPEVTHGTNFLGDAWNHALNAAGGYSQDKLIQDSGHGVGATVGDMVGGLIPVGAGAVGGAGLGTLSLTPFGVGAGAVGGGIAGATAAGAAQDAQAQRLEGKKDLDVGRLLGAGGIQGVLQALPVLKSERIIAALLKNAALHGTAAGAATVGQQALEQHTLTPKLDASRIAAMAALGGAGGALGGALHGKTSVSPEATPDVAEGVPEITHQGASINSEEDLKRALNIDYQRQQLAKKMALIDSGAQPISHGDMLKGLDSQLQGSLSKFPDSIEPKGSPSMPDVMPPLKSAEESSRVFSEQHQNIETAQSIAKDATQARIDAEHELSQATGIHDDPVAAQRALGQRILDNEHVRQFQRTPEMAADKELLQRVLDTRRQELEAHSLLEQENAPVRRSELPSPEPIESRLPSRPVDMMDSIDSSKAQYSEPIGMSLEHTGIDPHGPSGLSIEHISPAPSPSTMETLHQAPEFEAGHPSLTTTDSGAEVFHQGAPLEQVQTEANKLQSSIAPKGGTLMSIAEAQHFVRKFMPDQMRHLMNVLEGGKNNQTVTIDHEPLNKGGTVRNSREVNPFAIEKRTIKGSREVQNLLHQYSAKGDGIGADLSAVRNNLVQRLQKYGITVNAADQNIEGSSRTARTRLNALANRLPEVERTHVYIHDHNFGESTRGEGLTAGSHRLDRITDSSLTGKEQTISAGEKYQNEIAPAYKAINEVMNHPEATPELRRVVKQMSTGGVTRNSLKELRSTLQNISSSVLQKLCGL